MPRVNVTPEDLKKSQIVEPEWFPAEVTAYEYAKSKDEKSFNHIYDFKLLAPPDNAGVVIKVWFNEKALGGNEYVQFHEAITGQKVDRKKGFSVEDPNNAVKRKLEVHVKNGTYNGRTTNNIDGYRPLQG